MQCKRAGHDRAWADSCATMSQIYLHPWALLLYVAQVLATDADEFPHETGVFTALDVDYQLSVVEGRPVRLQPVRLHSSGAVSRLWYGPAFPPSSCVHKDPAAVSVRRFGSCPRCPWPLPRGSLATRPLNLPLGCLCLASRGSRRAVAKGAGLSDRVRRLTGGPRNLGRRMRRTGNYAAGRCAAGLLGHHLPKALPAEARGRSGWAVRRSRPTGSREQLRPLATGQPLHASQATAELCGRRRATTAGGASSLHHMSWHPCRPAARCRETRGGRRGKHRLSVATFPTGGLMAACHK
mmetsp:Transcript_53139/g.170251  ORF Transcript_53139/g.170251 Transcript_53139/m.170251 type:complete len:295 (-) Transcript_53139:14-898(-)